MVGFPAECRHSRWWLGMSWSSQETTGPEIYAVSWQIGMPSDVSPGKATHIAPAHGIARVELKRPFHLSNSGLRLADKIEAIADSHGRVSKIGVELECNLSLSKPKFCFLSPYVNRSEAHMRDCRTVVQRHRLAGCRKTLPQ